MTLGAIDAVAAFSMGEPGRLDWNLASRAA
jgi:hypothetical protein